MNDRKRNARQDARPSGKRQAGNSRSSRSLCRGSPTSKNVDFAPGLTQGRTGSGDTGAAAGPSVLRRKNPAASLHSLLGQIRHAITQLRTTDGNDLEERTKEQIIEFFGKLRESHSLDEQASSQIEQGVIRVMRKRGAGPAIAELERRCVDAAADIELCLARDNGAEEEPEQEQRARQPSTPPAPHRLTYARPNASSAASRVDHFQEYKDLLPTFFQHDPRGDGHLKDDRVCIEMSKVIRQIDNFARDFLGGSIVPANFFNKLLDENNECLIRYIGRLAIGGPDGENSWKKLVTRTKTRHALVVGIIGCALKEHVFSALWFGATREEQATLTGLETSVEYKSRDGFWRNENRAETVSTFAQDRNSFEFECHKVTCELAKMLAPFKDGEHTSLDTAQYTTLLDIVSRAAVLSRLMRTAPDVIYYWHPTFKDEEFEPARMECLNLWEMSKESPYEREQISGMEKAKDRDMSMAIVQIVCFPGLVAYRQGGGEQAERELSVETRRPDGALPDVRQARDRYNQPITETHGFRSKVVCKCIVYLQWGKQRLLTKEAGTSAHIDAVKNGTMSRYDGDYAGFAELYDIARSRWSRQRVAE